MHSFKKHLDYIMKGKRERKKKKKRMNCTVNVLFFVGAVRKGMEDGTRKYAKGHFSVYIMPPEIVGAT